MKNDNDHIARVAREWVINRPDYSKRASFWSNSEMAEAFAAGVWFCQEELMESESDPEPSLQEQVEALQAYVDVMQRKILDLEKCIDVQNLSIGLVNEGLKKTADAVEAMWHMWTRGV